MVNPVGAPPSPAVTVTPIFDAADVSQTIEGTPGVGVAVGVGVGVGHGGSAHLWAHKSPTLYWLRIVTRLDTASGVMQPFPIGGITCEPITTSESAIVCAMQSLGAFRQAMLSLAAISSLASCRSPFAWRWQA